MKSTVFALAALLATSGIALAGNAPKAPAAETVCTAAQIKAGTVDCSSTGSVDAAKSTPAKPRLGYDGNPWIVPSF